MIMSYVYAYEVKQLVWITICTSSSLLFVTVKMGGSDDTHTDSTARVDAQTDNGLCSYNFMDR